MTLGEFKAWLEGFSEGFNGKAPTKAQWQRIQKRLDEVQEEITPITVRPWIEVRPWWPSPWYNGPIATWGGSCGSRSSTTFTLSSNNADEPVNIYNAAKEIGSWEAEQLEA